MQGVFSHWLTGEVENVPMQNDEIEKVRSRKLLITGASGFVGLCLLERLVKDGRDDIVALHNRILDNGIRDRFGSAVHWKKCNIADDDLTEVVKGVHTVFHLAARFSANISNDKNASSLDVMEKVNVFGTKRLATLCKKSGVRHFIFVSSIAACEEGQKSEINELNGFPVSAYGKSKKSAEDLLLALCGDGFEVTVLRATALFGENHLGSFYELVKRISRGQFVIFGDGENYTNFYYIQDFVDILLATQHNSKAYGQVFIAADKPCTLHELILCIAEALGYKKTILRVPALCGSIISVCCDLVSRLSGKILPFSRRRFRAMIRDTAYSSLKLEKILGVQPTYGLHEGIKRTVAWYRKADLI